MSIGTFKVAYLSATVALIAGCNAITPPQSAFPEPVSLAHMEPSWIDPAAKGEALVYVTNRRTGEINILSFPQGVPVGAISGFEEPEGECVDAAGDVFVTDSKTAQVTVFAHGGVVPIRTLSYPRAQPFDCSIDPATGNLAVSNRLFSRKPHSVVAIYAAAKGSPKTYEHAAFQTEYCGYDNHGNLFLDGSDHRTEMAELPKGSSTIVNVTLNQPIASQGTIQWDGQYVAVTSTREAIVYRILFNGRHGKIVGSTSLAGGVSVTHSWIRGDKILGPDNYVYVWPYPSGGDPIRRYDGFAEPMDAVVTEPREVHRT